MLGSEDIEDDALTQKKIFFEKNSLQNRKCVIFTFEL
jgi:hypothetical protein